jgi:SAM-dependent methyltransferase
LEVGCATGEFCKVLNGSGALPIGCDLSPYAIQEAGKRYQGIEFKLGGISEIVVSQGFDAVFAFEVIEHVLSPSAFFRDAHKLLKPGGFFILSTPNAECCRRIGPANWYGFQHSFEHLFFFEAQTLSRLAAQTGFEQVEVYSSGGSGDVRPQPSPPAKTLAKRLLRITGLLKLIRETRNRAKRSPRFKARAYQRGSMQHDLFWIGRRS